MKNVIAQGAEALLIKKNSHLLKRRVTKGYRLPELDEKIRKQRTKREARVLQKTAKLIPVPELITVREKEKEIDMEFIEGKRLSDHLESLSNAEWICNQIGKHIAKLHDNGIIHGDLTTSNMIFSDSKLYFIDFGLSFISDRIEDKAVDLHLIKEALEAKHFENYEKFFKAVLKGYKSSKKYKQTLERLKKVESRGRYKAQY